MKLRVEVSLYSCASPLFDFKDDECFDLAAVVEAGDDGKIDLVDVAGQMKAAGWQPSVEHGDVLRFKNHTEEGTTP